MKIRNGVGLMPGGVIFVDPKVPSARWMDDHTFLEDRVKEVISFRANNPSVYPPNEAQYFDPAFVSNEITVYNCTRLGNDPRFCLDETARGPVPAHVPSRLCDVCAVELTPKYCPTCAGKRLIGWVCPTCSREYPK